METSWRIGKIITITWKEFVRGIRYLTIVTLIRLIINIKLNLNNRLRGLRRIKIRRKVVIS